MKIIGLLIVKNDADILKDMLDHAAKWMDGVVAIDNGSNDDSYLILKNHKIVLKWDQDDGMFDESRLVPKLIDMAADFSADWYVDNDADEFFNPAIRPILENIPKGYNIVTVTINSEINKRVYNQKRKWRRIYKNDSVLFDFSVLKQLHGGKVPIPEEKRVIFDSNVPVKHIPVRSYEQGMRKYNNYLAIDTCGIQASYEHIKYLAELCRYSWDQLTDRLSKRWKYKSNKIYFMCHTWNGGDALERLLNSIKPLTDNIIVLIDSRTNDNSRYICDKLGVFHEDFTWRYSFSEAKNLCLKIARKKCGAKFGDWFFFAGDDFELQAHTIPEIRAFVNNPKNFFAQFAVPEFEPEKGTPYVNRKRKLLGRMYPGFYWQGLVHEEIINSAYRVTGIGIPFGGIPWKEVPILGDDNGMLHYGYHEDGSEDGELFHRKKSLYYVLYQMQQVISRYRLPETPIGMLEAIAGIEGKIFKKLFYRYMPNSLIHKHIARKVEKMIQKMVDDHERGVTPIEITPLYDPDLNVSENYI